MDLPDDLQLPLDRGAPWWYWLAGRAPPGFVNTHRERWWRNVETLVTTEDLAEWVVKAGLVSEPPPIDRGLLVAARELREAISVTTDAIIARTAANDGALSIIEGWLPEAQLPERLAVPAGGAMPVISAGAPARPGRYALGLLARDAALMLGTEQ